ncbi:MAG: aminoglycoside phosphotransferase family protein [Rubellimicrobium sp.]|nr:aminoglycoside phosphotransferase family protein [Rubellimicrobium sp.]
MLAERAIALVRELGLVPDDLVPEVQPLTGGVASDIGLVRWPGGEAVVKFALEKLRVKEDWQVPVSRNAAEYAWLSFAGAVMAEVAPRLLGRNEALGGFAMEMVEGAEVWKTLMLSGRSVGAEAPAVGAALGRLHAASCAPGFDAAPFDNMPLFHALRIEPYLLFTATRHPPLAVRIAALAEGLEATRPVLIHGDVSPKNILIRGGGPVFLDAECATMGDPAFDLAFCINHLILKGFHMPAAQAPLWAAAGSLWAAYAPHVTWEDDSALQARVAALLPALMLARIDGKSPVEYLTEDTRQKVRRAALPLIAGPAPTLSALIARLKDHI